MNKKMIITISRTFGSGGHDIGEKLAKKLEIPFYDKNLLKMMSDKTGISEEGLENADEKLLYQYTDSYSIAFGQDYSTNIYLYKVQKKLIHELAEKSSCVIVGRLADWILRENPDLLRVFVMAPEEFRVSRIMEQEKITEKQAEKLIRQMDKLRRNYYSFFTDGKWDDMENKDIIINSSLRGIDGTVEILKSIVNSL
jgi:cytidylate kinase